MPGIRRFAIVTLTAAALVVPRRAAAQTSASDVATAQALFDDAKRLMGEGRYADACPKLAESQRLDPGGGTMLALGLCHEGEGKTATAWAEFNVALTEARKDRRADREAAAAQHVRALEPRLVRLRVVVTADVPGLTVRRGAVETTRAQWGTALPVDPGDYAFQASAPGKKTWAATIAARDPGTTTDVRVPALDDAPVAVVPVAPVAAVAPAPVRAPAPTPTPLAPRPEPAADHTIAIVTGGVGLVAAGLGLGFGLSAGSKWNQAKVACPGLSCTTDAGMALGNQARGAADASTAFFVVGGVALAASAVLFATAPIRSAPATGLRVAPLVTAGGAGVAFGGSL